MESMDSSVEIAGIAFSIVCSLVNWYHTRGQLLDSGAQQMARSSAPHELL